MRFRRQFTPGFAGSLLVAHPGMLDPNFQRSVILLSADSKDMGTVGVVLNMPTGKTMGEFDAKFGDTPLSSIPVYFGGPMEQQLIILTAWEWAESASVFKLEFGITEEKAVELMHLPNIEVRAFMGYSGWTHEQLEGELEQHAWLMSSVKSLSAPKDQDGPALWRAIISEIKPDLMFLADAPDDLADN